MIKKQVAEFADRALATWTAKNQLRNSPRLSVCVAHYDRKSNAEQGRQIIDIIPNERNALGANVKMFEQLDEPGSLVGDTLNDLDAKLCTTRGHDRVGFCR